MPILQLNFHELTAVFLGSTDDVRIMMMMMMMMMIMVKLSLQISLTNSSGAVYIGTYGSLRPV